MIKFFRKIRQKLFLENKFSHYLFYTIGEIVLVIIGILLALQINSWNNEKTDINHLKDNLIFLIEDLESDKTQLTQLKEERLLNVSYCSEFIDNYEFDKPVVSKEPLKNWLSILSEVNFKNNQSGFDRVKSSKIFEFESIEEIRNRISGYEQALEFIRFQEDNQNAHIEAMEKVLWVDGFSNKFYPFVRSMRYKDKFEMPSNKIDLPKMISQSEPAKAILARYEFAMLWIVSLYDDLILRGEELKLEIEKYVSKN